MVATRKGKDSQPLIDVAPDIAPVTDEKHQAYKPDDDHLAIALAAQIGDKVAFFHSAWKVYERGVWGERDNAELRKYIRGELRGWRDRGVQVSQNRIKSLASMLEDDLYISDRKVLKTSLEQSKYVNLRNGLFNLETMQLEPHRPDELATGARDDGAACRATAAQGTRKGPVGEEGIHARPPSTGTDPRGARLDRRLGGGGDRIGGHARVDVHRRWRYRGRRGVARTTARTPAQGAFHSPTRGPLGGKTGGSRGCQANRRRVARAPGGSGPR